MKTTQSEAYASLCVIAWYGAIRAQYAMESTAASIPTLQLQKNG